MGFVYVKDVQRYTIHTSHFSQLLSQNLSSYMAELNVLKRSEKIIISVNQSTLKNQEEVIPYKVFDHCLPKVGKT